MNREILFRGKRVDSANRKPRRKDLSGLVFGAVTVIKFSHVTDNGDAVWECKCKCGNIYKSLRSNLIRMKGVGCYECRNRKLRDDKTKHGESGTRLHNIWQHMLVRCNKDGSPDFKNYGGRGIKVCPEWENDFKPFYEWSLSTGYSDDLTIDRIDVNGDYCPENCRWATRKEQNNNRRVNKYYELNGETMTLSGWCEHFGVDYDLARGRIKRGHSIYTALFHPKNTTGKPLSNTIHDTHLTQQS